jgi:hypothetical protein
MILSCRSVILRLDEHEEGRCSRWARAGIRLHLGLCGECYRYLQQMRTIRAAAGALEATPVSPQTKALLMQRFRAWQAGRPREGER